MNYDDLFEGRYVNGNPTYYVDKNCTIPFTGHFEEYFKGKLARECDIEDGLMDGVEKVYHDFSDKLDIYREVKNNRGNGLAIEYYESGRVRAISIVINDYYIIDFYIYTEEGKQEEIWILEEGDQWQHHCYYYGKDDRPRESWRRADGGLDPMDYNANKEKILEMRKKYQLEKMNEEILKYGKPLGH